MRKIILFILLFTYISGLSQDTEKKELTEQEIEYLAKDIHGGMVKPKAKDYENSVKNNLVNYGFEILYNGKVIYRGGIKKPSVSDITYGLNRKNASFCFEYDTFDSDTKLELVENKKMKIGKTESGKKYFWTDNYELFTMDNYKGLKVNNKISEKIEIKFYKF